MEVKQTHRGVKMWPMFWNLLLLLPSLTSAFVYDLNLQVSQIVTLNQVVEFTCTTSPRPNTNTVIVDPVIKWDIRQNYSSPFGTDLTSSSSYESDGNPTPGNVINRLSFTLLSQYIGQTVFCSAHVPNNTNADSQIFAVLQETTVRVNINGQCVSPSRSCISNAFCNTAGVCECNSGYYAQTLSSCAIIQSTARVGDACGGSVSCSSVNSYCGGSGTCLCSSNYIYYSSTDRCDPARTYSQTCNTGDNINTCTGTSNAYCVSNSGICQCLSGYVYDSGSCTQQTTSVNVGSSCAGTGVTCATPNSYCNGNTQVCTCDSPRVYYSGSNTCVLETGTLGSQCSSQSSCQVANSDCVNNVCSCLSGYITRASSTCEYPVVNEECSVDVGCRSATSGSTVGNPECSTGILVCTCSSDYYTLSSSCYRKSLVGASCNSAAASCMDNNAQCIGGTCQCNTGYSKSGNVCVFTNTGTASCAAGTQVEVTVPGSSTFPTTPDVTVSKTCYEVNLQNTVVLDCRETGSRAALQFAGWKKLSTGENITQTTGQFINGVAENPSLTVSNAKASYQDRYKCKICYDLAQTRCTESPEIYLYVNGTEISSVTLTVTPSTTTPQKGSQMTFSCQTGPAGISGTTYQLRRNNVAITNTNQYAVASAQTSHAGTYECVVTYQGTTYRSNQIVIDLQYKPEFSLSGGGDTAVVSGNTATVDLDCTMSANPAVTTYQLYLNNNNADLVASSSVSGIFSVNATLYGTQIYKCQAENDVGLSSFKYFTVVEPEPPSTGAATENTGIGTGTIAAIVLGIIFLLLLIIIIIVCCCSYGWCRKKEKVQPAMIVEKPVTKQYIARSIVSASSTVTRKDVGVVVNGHPDNSAPAEFTTPRYYLKPATSAGPIISMFDNTYDQPRAHQIPALDTQYLYTEEEPKKRRKHRRKRKHREHSPRRSYEPEVREETRYAEVTPPSDDDLVVIPGKNAQNYFE